MAGSDFVLTGSRLQNATRVNQAAEDGDVTGWDTAADFVFCAMVETTKHGGATATMQLRWRNVTDAGAFAALAATGELNWTGTTDLANGNAVTSGEAVCTPTAGTTYANGVEREGANDVSTTLAQNEYTEHQWAIDASGAGAGDQYEFEIYDSTAGASLGTCAAQITMDAGALTGEGSLDSGDSSLSASGDLVSSGEGSLGSGDSSLSASGFRLETGAHFESTTPDYFTGVSAVGASDNATLTDVFWYYHDSTASLPAVLWLTSGTAFRCRILAGTGGKDKIEIVAKNPSGTVVLRLQSNAALVQNAWNLVAVSANLSASPTVHLRINKVDEDDTGYVDRTVTPSETIDHSISNWAISDPTNPTDGALQCFYYTNEYVDLSADEDKFVTSENKPNLGGIGSDGSGVTGTQPLIWLRDPYDSFETNYGSLGNFTVSGALTDNGTYPEFTPIHFGSGSLVSGDSSLAASGILSASGEGDLASGNSSISGEGTASSGYVGQGALVSAASMITGEGASSSSGEGSLDSANAAVSGEGTLSSVGAGSLDSGDSSLSGEGSLTSSGEGSLASGDSSLSGEGVSASSGEGDLISGAASLSGEGSVATPAGGLSADLRTSSLVSGHNLSITPGSDVDKIRQQSGWGHPALPVSGPPSTPGVADESRRAAVGLVSGHNFGISPGSEPAVIRAMAGWGYPAIPAQTTAPSAAVLFKFNYRKKRPKAQKAA